MNRDPPLNLSVLGSKLNRMHHDATSSERVFRRHRWMWTGVAFALVFPSVVTWAYFLEAADASAGVQQSVMAVLKVVQFVFPLVWVWLVLGERIECPAATTAGLGLGLAFGLAVVLVGWLLYTLWLGASPFFLAAVEPIRAKVASFGLDSAWKFVALGAFYAVIHSLLEEYYWRWLVFGQLRQLVPLWPAILASALGFMAHHVLVLSLYFGWWSWPTMLLSGAVAVGGAIWAWLYARSGSLLGPWLSHAVVDAGIFAVGYHLLGDALVH